MKIEPGRVYINKIELPSFDFKMKGDGPQSFDIPVCKPGEYEVYVCEVVRKNITYRRHAGPLGCHNKPEIINRTGFKRMFEAKLISDHWPVYRTPVLVD